MEHKKMKVCIMIYVTGLTTQEPSKRKIRSLVDSLFSNKLQNY